jgi:hypothetical protein
MDDGEKDIGSARQWTRQCLDWLDSNSDPPRWVPPEDPRWAWELADGFSERLRRTGPIQAARVSQMSRHLAAWMMKVLQTSGGQSDQDSLECAQRVGQIYPQIHRFELPGAEGALLQLLAWSRHRKPLELLVELLIGLPPHDWTATAQAIGPLLRHRDWPVESVFPRLLAAVSHPSTAATALDLANFSVRQGIVREHPARSQAVALAGLLGDVVGRLGQLEQDPTRFGKTVQEVQGVLSESVALSVALCDCLGLIGDPATIGKLHQAAGVAHRRVQTEAAAALARLGDEAGKAQLVGLANEPSARLRVLAYAQELGLSDRVESRFATPLAQAEAELAAWLSQPDQMGLAPSEIELVSQRTQFWPGFDAPQDCFLFRYAYRFGDAQFSNVGMAGPIVHSFASDLADIPEDDIYAAFAGWCAEHDDIYEVDEPSLNPAQRREAQRLAAFLEREGYRCLRILFLGFFVGERVVVCETQLNETPGIAAADGLEILWFPTQGRMRPLGPREVYGIYKGRKLLRTFNPAVDS